MEIIDSKPKVRYKIDHKPSVFKTTYDQEKWWDRTKTKWIEGDQGLSGMHVFYMTQTPIKDRNTGEVALPRYRDCDDWVISKVHDHFWNPSKGALGALKRREFGATSIGAALLPLYTQRIFPGSTFGMTSCDKDRIFKAYTDKFSVALTGMDADIRPTITKKAESKNSNVYLQLQWKTKKNDKTELQYSDFFTKETASDDKAAKGFSGTGMRAAYYDEFPLHLRRNQLLTSSRPCFMKGAEQAGFLLWSGTLEEGLTNEDIVEIQNIVKDAELMKTEVLFIPAWWGLIMDDEGNSDEKAGTEWVEREIERLEKAQDKLELRNFRKNYPLYLKDIFDLGSTSFFSEKTVDCLKAQADAIDKKPENFLEIPHKLISLNDKVEAEPVNQKNPKFIIQEHPKDGVDYFMVIDGVATGKETGGSNKTKTKNKSAQQNKMSKVAAIIVKTFDIATGMVFQPVAYMLDRPNLAQESYPDILELAMYYNKFGRFQKCCAEANAGTADHFTTHLERQGKKQWVAKRKDLSGKGNTDTDKYGQYVNDYVKDWQKKELDLLLKKYAHCITMKSIIVDLLQPTTVNADLRSAMMLIPVYFHGTDFEKPPSEPEVIMMMIPKYNQRTGRIDWIKTEHNAEPVKT